MNREAWSWSMKHDHEAWSMSMKHEHEAYTWGINMKHKHEAWAWSINMRHEHEAWIWSMGHEHEHESWSWIIGMKHDHEAWAWSMTHEAWAWSMTHEALSCYFEVPITYVCAPLLFYIYRCHLRLSVLCFRRWFMGEYDWPITPSIYLHAWTFVYVRRKQYNSVVLTTCSRAIVYLWTWYLYGVLMIFIWASVINHDITKVMGQ
jgi:hypothetical protein